MLKRIPSIDDMTSDEKTQLKPPPSEQPRVAGLGSRAFVGDYDAFGRRTDNVERDEENLQYRFQYRFWRQGNSKGCAMTSAGPARVPEVVVIKAAAPVLSAWDVRPNEVTRV